MFWIEWVSVSMVGVGACFMLFSILVAVAMLPRLADYYRKRWTLLTIFKGFFLVGYLAFIAILVMELELPLEFITAMIFLGGALFVFWVILLTKRTIVDLTDKDAALNELNATLEQKVLQRTRALGESMAELANEVEEREKANRKIASMGEELRVILDTISTGVRVIDLNYNVVQVNQQFSTITGLSREELIGHPCYTNFAGGDCRNSEGCKLQAIRKKPERHECITKKVASNGSELHFRVTSAPMWGSEGEVVGIVEDFQDITPLVKSQEEKEQARNRLHQAAKLESVGQLAAGIAHEINTPVQFVTTNFDFLRESLDDIAVFMGKIQDSMSQEKIDTDLNQAMEELDWEFLSEEVPRAIEQSVEGMDRVRKLVLAMKAFSHPSTREMAPADLNAILENSIIISQNEWKHVAELKTEFSPDLPLVPCLADEMGQVFLSIIVNAGHAIEDKVQGTHDKGYITVRTAAGAGVVEVIISDTGKGMDDELCGKIFDPFFTTKEVGRGTGQGLSIAYDIVVNKHHGEIKVKSTPAVGTTFTILLPE